MCLDSPALSLALTVLSGVLAPQPQSVEDCGSVAVTDLRLAAVEPEAGADPGDSAGAPLALGTFGEDDLVVPTSGGAWSTFGECLSMEGGSLVVGSPGTNAAYIFDRGGGGLWNQRRRILGGCSYGEGVATDGVTAVVGDPWREPTFCTGSGVSELLSAAGGSWTSLGGRSIGWPQYGFGYSAAVAGSEMVVAAVGHTPCFLISGPPAFAAYRKVGSTWGLTGVFAAEATTLGDRFGWDVDLRADGALAVVGAPQVRGGSGQFRGAAYVFANGGSTWTELQALAPSKGGGSQRFGSSVAIQGNLIAVGSPNAQSPGATSGAVFLFRFDGSQWLEQQVIFGQAPGESFGTSVAMDGALLAVGAPGSRTAYVYRKQESVFRLVQRCRASAGFQAGTSFAVDVALDGETCAVGAPWATTGSGYSGAVALYEVQDLALTSDLQDAGGVRTLALLVQGGLPGARVVIALSSSSSSLASGGVGPGSAAVLGLTSAFRGVFDAEGAFIANAVLSPGSVGRTVTLQAFGLNGPNSQVASNAVRLGL